MPAGNLRAAGRGAAFLGLTFLLIGLYPLVCALGPRWRQAIRRLWSRLTCRLFGIRVTTHGTPFAACPTLFVPNHVSYLDILILGCSLDATFIAKAEVEGWPLLGYMARRVGTMFIRRHWRQARIQRDAIAARMAAGESFVLFAEGTSSNGLGVKPLKTSLLSVAEPWVMERPVAVQPVTLAYRRLADGSPFSAANCDLYAWYDDMVFAPHLWAMLKLPGVEVEVAYHAPVLSRSVRSRKILGPALRAEIADRLAALRGESAAPARAAPAPLPQPVAS